MIKTTREPSLETPPLSLSSACIEEAIAGGDQNTHRPLHLLAFARGGII